MKNEIKTIKAANLFPFITDIMEMGQNVRIAVTGSSMSPFLHDKIDSVELSKGDFSLISRGDIVMIRRNSGAYVMHRVYKKEIDCFYMVGDAQQWIEGPLYPGQLIAVVPSVWRKGRHISCSNPCWRALSWLWLLVLPVRNYIFRLIRLLKRPFKFH